MKHEQHVVPLREQSRVGAATLSASDDADTWQGDCLCRFGHGMDRGRRELAIIDTPLLAALNQLGLGRTN
jgi:hypothetical protein